MSSNSGPVLIGFITEVHKEQPHVEAANLFLKFVRSYAADRMKDCNCEDEGRRMDAISVYIPTECWTREFSYALKCIQLDSIYEEWLLSDHDRDHASRNYSCWLRSMSHFRGIQIFCKKKPGSGCHNRVVILFKIFQTEEDSELANKFIAVNKELDSDEYPGEVKSEIASSNVMLFLNDAMFARLPAISGAYRGVYGFPVYCIHWDSNGDDVFVKN